MSIETILEVCRTINHRRDIESPFDHLEGEIEELREEISYKLNDMNPGKDGIIGEAVDCILCLVDIIYQADKTVSLVEINDVIKKKLAKWQKVYGVDEEKKRIIESCSLESEIEFYNSMHHPSQHIKMSEKTQVEKDVDRINAGSEFYPRDNF